MGEFNESGWEIVESEFGCGVVTPPGTARPNAEREGGAGAYPTLGVGTGVSPARAAEVQTESETNKRVNICLDFVRFHRIFARNVNSRLLITEKRQYNCPLEATNGKKEN